MKFYIASPFFNERQIEIVEEVKAILIRAELAYFSPKDDCLFVDDSGMDSKKIFEANCQQIDDCDGVIVVTDGRDVGTMWEAGYAFGKNNIIYVWVDHIEGQKFNLMLAHSAHITTKGLLELERVLEVASATGVVPQRVYSGAME